MLVKDDTFKLIPVSKPYCDVCKRNTFHLLKHCTEHSDWNVRVRKQVNKVLNTIIPTGDDSYRDYTPAISIPLTLNQRRSKFNKAEGTSHKWEYIDGQEEPLDQSLPRCASCNEVIEVSTSAYGRVAVKLYKKQIDFERTIAGSVFPARRYVRIPEYKKGYVCSTCYKDLWADYYLNDKGEKVRSIIPLDSPTNTIRVTDKIGRRVIERSIPVARLKERNTRDNSFPSGRQQVKYVATVVLDHGIPTDEEWKTSTPKPMREPISKQGMSYAYRGSVHPEFCGCVKCKHRDR